MDQSFAFSTLNASDRIIYHDLWSAACLLHPGLRSLSFIHDASVRVSVKQKGECPFREIM